MQTEQKDSITPNGGKALIETNYGALSTLVTVFSFGDSLQRVIVCSFPSANIIFI